MVRIDGWSSRMLALISLESTWTRSIFTRQTGLKSKSDSDLRYPADQFRTLSLSKVLQLTTISLPYESELIHTGILFFNLSLPNCNRGRLDSSGLGAYRKVFYFLIFFSSGVIRLNKDGSGETPVGPPSFGKLNGISLYHQGGWFKCSFVKMTLNPGHFT